MLRGKILTLEEFPSKHEPYWGSVKPEECKFDKDIYTLAVKCAKDFISSNSATYKEKYKVFRNEDGAWNNVEAKYEECLLEVMNNRSQQHPTEEVERILGDYGLNDYGEVNFYGYSFESYDEELAIIFNFISLLDEFEKDLQSYLRTNCNDQKLKLLTDRKAVSKILDKSDCIITFNYTHTAELLYGATQTIHIHSDIDNTIAIGSGALEDAKNSTIDYEYPTRDSFPKNKDGLIEMMMYYTDDMNGHLVEDSFIRRFFDGVAVEASKKEAELFDLLDSKSKDALDERQSVIELLQSNLFDTVYIIGHSLGIADHAVFKAINKDAHVIYFYHNKEERCQIELILTEFGMDFEMIPDTSLYQ